MTSFLPWDDDASLSITASNQSLAVSLSSTTESVYMRMFGVENSNLGFLIGTSNVTETLPKFMIGKVTNCNVGPVQDLVVYEGNIGIGISDPKRKLDIAGDLQLQNNVYRQGTLWLQGNSVHDLLIPGNVGIGTTTVASSGLQITGTLTMQGNLVPITCNVYDLGSDSQRFRDLWLSGTSLYLSQTRISACNQGAVYLQNATTNDLVSIHAIGADLTQLNASAITTGTITNARLPSAISVASVSADGSSLSNLNATFITAGTLSADRLSVSGVTPGIYGTPSNIPVLTIDDKGRVTAISTQLVEGNDLWNLNNPGVITTYSNVEVTGSLLTTSNLHVISGLTFSPTATTVSTNLQVSPKSLKTIVSATTLSNLTVSVPGFYIGDGSNVDVFVNGFKKTYYDNQISDYTVSYTYDYINSNTDYLITFGDIANYGDLIDITVWPQLQQPSGALPGTVFQYINTPGSWSLQNNNSIYYTMGNVGIGTTLPQQTVHVQGNLLVSGKHMAETFFQVVIGDETTPLTTGTAKWTWRAPYAMTLTRIPRASLSTASSSGDVTIDINVGGATILGLNKLSIDVNEKTSVTATTPTTLVTTAIADDAEITIDIDTAGTGASGLKIVFYYSRS